MSTPAPLPTSPHSPTPPEPKPWEFIITMCIVFILLVGIGGCASCSGGAKKQAKKAALEEQLSETRQIIATLKAAMNTNPPIRLATKGSKPFFASLTTPATLPLDFPFRIESYGKPVRITYSDGSSFIYNSPDQKFPVPPVGPKTFEAPEDPAGHVLFRLYGQ